MAVGSSPLAQQHGQSVSHVGSHPQLRSNGITNSFTCRIVAGALPCWVWRRPASPHPAWRPLAALHNYKARVPLALARLCAAGTPSVLIYFVTLSLRPPRPANPVSGPNCPNTPARTGCCAQSPPSNLLRDNLGPLAILPRSTRLRWPPALIRPSLHHTVLVDGLAVAMT
jgi:hypothetical protein